MSFIKSIKTWLTVGVIIAIILSFTIGTTSAKVTLEEEKMGYSEIKQKISDAQSELDDKEEELADALKVIEERDSIASEISELETSIGDMKVEMASLNGSIDSKKKELKSIGVQIKEKKEEPLEFSAGVYIVGNDFPSGRYLAKPLGKGSNFAVYDGSGSLVVNTILSNREGHGVSEYLTLLGVDFVIESDTPFTLQEME